MDLPHYVHGYVIFEPDGDRPYFSHHLPAEYAKRPGARVFRFSLALPQAAYGQGIEEVDITQAKVLADIAAERQRQDRKFPVDYADGTGDAGKAAAQILNDICSQATADGTCTFAQVLTEEASEVLVETDLEKLRKELVQCGAVCVKWIESLDRRRLAGPFPGLTLDEAERRYKEEVDTR